MRSNKQYYKSTDFGSTFSDTGLYDNYGWYQRKPLSISANGDLVRILIDSSIYTSIDYLSTFQKDDYTLSVESIHILKNDITVVHSFGSYHDLFIDISCSNNALVCKSIKPSKFVARRNEIVAGRCRGGSISTPSGGCEPCTLGYYTPGLYDTDTCLKCPPLRVAVHSPGCSGLDRTSMYNSFSRLCYCDGYMIGISGSLSTGIIVAMMSCYLFLVVYFIREVVSLNLMVSKFSLLSLALTVLLSALDTTTDLVYILSNPFGSEILLGLTVFFYMANIVPYTNYMRVNKSGILKSLVTTPPFLSSRYSTLIAPYCIVMFIKSVILFIVGYLLYTSKLLMLAPIHNKFMFWFTNSNQFQISDLVDNVHFTQSVYYELFFEATPQIILQVLNWWYYIDLGGSIYANNPTLLVSIISSGLTFLFQVQRIVRTKLAGKKVSDMKTGFEGIVYKAITQDKVSRIAVES